MDKLRNVMRLQGELSLAIADLAEGGEGTRAAIGRPRKNDPRNAVIFYLYEIAGYSTAQVRDAIYRLDEHWEKITPTRPEPLSEEKRQASDTVRKALRQMGVSLRGDGGE